MNTSVNRLLANYIASRGIISNIFLSTIQGALHVFASLVTWVESRDNRKNYYKDGLWSAWPIWHSLSFDDTVGHFFYIPFDTSVTDESQRSKVRKLITQFSLEHSTRSETTAFCQPINTGHH